MKLIKVVSNKINKMLGLKGWSIYKLSRKTGLAPNSIQSIISCKYSDIKLSTIIIIAHAFDMTASEFIDDKDFEYDNLEIDKL